MQVQLVDEMKAGRIGKVTVDEHGVWEVMMNVKKL